MRLAFYITGHGFGHTTRCLPVIAALQEHAEVNIRTNAPRRLFDQELTRPFTHDPVTLDVGAVQHDALTVDRAASLENFAALWAGREALIDRECRALEREGVAGVMCDIPALAALIAARAGVPCLAMTNFSWDWIYHDYLPDFPQYRTLVDELSDAYGQTRLLFRLPFAGDLSAFPHQRAVPLVCRPLRESREVVRRRLGLTDDRTAVLVSFGGFAQAGWGAQELARLDGFDFVVPGQWRVSQPMPPNVRVLPDGAFHHPDLVAAVDTVLGKLGYGLVSECVRAQTPLLVVRRSHFAEQAVFFKELPDAVPLAELPAESFFAGRWEPALAELAAQRGRPPRNCPAFDGAQVVAREALELFGAGPSK